ncbi:hypothetical protein D9M68_995600 [compost metagenome]
MAGLFRQHQFQPAVGVARGAADVGGFDVTIVRKTQTHGHVEVITVFAPDVAPHAAGQRITGGDVGQLVAQGLARTEAEPVG